MNHRFVTGSHDCPINTRVSDSLGKLGMRFRSFSEVFRSAMEFLAVDEKVGLGVQYDTLKIKCSEWVIYYIRQPPHYELKKDTFPPSHKRTLRLQCESDSGARGVSCDSAPPLSDSISV